MQSLIGRFERRAVVGGARGGRVRKRRRRAAAGERGCFRRGRVESPFFFRLCGFLGVRARCLSTRTDIRRTGEAVTGRGEGQRPVPL